MELSNGGGLQVVTPVIVQWCLGPVECGGFLVASTDRCFVKWVRVCFIHVLNY